MNALIKNLVTCLAIGVTTVTAQANTHSPEAVSTPDPLAQMRAEHVMISTGDYDGTMTWYQEKLGFEVYHEWKVPEFPGVRLAYLERNGFIIEVVYTEHAMQEKRAPKDLAEALGDRGFGHLAFLVTDVDAVAAELSKRGVQMVVPPTSFPDSGRRLIFIQDNNGNYIEFLTPLSAYPQVTGNEH